MVLVLLAITLLCSVAVGMVYRMTEAPIAQAKAAKVTQAIARVLPEFDNNPADISRTYTVDGEEMIVYPAMTGADTVGFAVETFSKNGFSGMIRLMVGLLPDGTIHRIETLSQNETPGLGDKIEHGKSGFAVQFEGKNPGDFKLIVKKEGGDVDAITASTITSRAFCDAVDRAYKLFQTRNESQGGEDGISAATLSVDTAGGATGDGGSAPLTSEQKGGDHE